MSRGPEREVDWGESEESFFAEASLVVEVWAEALAMGRRGPFDRAPLPYVGASALMHTLFLLLALTIPPTQLEHVDLSRYAPQDRFISFVPEPPAAPEPPARIAHALRGDGDDEQIGHKQRGDSGAAGAKRAERERGRVSVKGDDARVRHERGSRRRESRAERDDSLGALAAVGMNLTSVDESLGQDALDALGRVDDAERDVAKGESALGISGQGRAGAGIDEGIGVSELLATPTARRGQRGVRDIAGVRAEARQIDVTRASETVSACLPGSTVRAAVARRVAQVRSCYEQGLLHDPDLDGRVEVVIEIAPDGSIRRLDARDVSLGSKSVIRCIEGKLETLAFPAFEGCESVVARYPFQFREAVDE